jgi:hypothetical protein
MMLADSAALVNSMLGFISFSGMTPIHIQLAKDRQ